MLEVEYSEKSKEDVREVVLWYNLQRQGLENEFLKNLNESVDQIKEYPFHYQKYFREIRSIILKRFPYRLIYKVIGNRIVIIGIFHTSRNPKLIRKRTKE